VPWGEGFGIPKEEREGKRKEKRGEGEEGAKGRRKGGRGQEDERQKTTFQFLSKGSE
jgi:hypothetical protein